MQHFWRQIDRTGWLQKRPVFTVPNAPTATPPVAVSPEIVAYRESIEDKSIPELQAEFDAQSADLLRQQQIVMEIVEDLNALNANIPQAEKNTIILHIAQAMESNSRLVIADDLKFSLGSHLRPGRGKLEQWGTKISLMAGTLGAMSEGMDENAPLGQRISGMMKWIKVLIAVISGKSIAAPSASTSTEVTATVPTAEQTVEAPPASAGPEALRSIAVVSNSANQAAGYLTVTGANNQVLKVKHDGSEIKDADGADVTNDARANSLKAFLQTKQNQINNVSTSVGKTSDGERVQMAASILTAQQRVNANPGPVDMAMVVNDNWTWLITQNPTYRAMTNQQRFDALTASATSGLNPILTALKGRYDIVRTTQLHLNRAKRDVRTKMDETLNFIITKLSNSTGPEATALRNEYELAVNGARSLQTPASVYAHIQQRLIAHGNTVHRIGEPYAPFGSAANITAITGKIRETSDYLTGRAQAAAPRTTT